MHEFSEHMSEEIDASLENTDKIIDLFQKTEKNSKELFTALDNMISEHH